VSLLYVVACLAVGLFAYAVIVMWVER